MTEEQKEKFDELVKQSGLTQSEFFRRCALKKKIYALGHSIFFEDFSP